MNINNNYSQVTFACKRTKTMQQGLNRVLKMMHVKEHSNVISAETEEGFGRKYVDKKGREILIYLDDIGIYIERTKCDGNKTIFEGLEKRNGVLRKYKEIVSSSQASGYTCQEKTLNWFDKIKLSLFGF